MKTRPSLFASLLPALVLFVPLVAGASPEAVIAAPGPVDEADPSVLLDGTGSFESEPGRTLIAYAWDLDDDGVFDDGSAAMVSYLIVDDGDWIVRLRVTNDLGQTAVAERTFTVGNIPPAIVTGTTTLEATAGGLLELGFLVFDTEDDVLTVTVDFGNGQVVPASSQAPTIFNGYYASTDYQTKGTFVLTITACDNDGACTSVSRNVLHVRNEPAATPQTVTTAPGAPIDITLSGVGELGGPVLFLEVVGGSGPLHGTLSGPMSWGDGLVAPSAVVTYTPAPGFTGTDALAFRVRDEADVAEGSGWSPFALVTIDVVDAGNHVPLAFIACMAPGTAGDPTWLNGWYEDPDGDTATALWSYTPIGDVGGATCTFSDPTDRWASFTCDGAGIFLLELAFTDTHGAVGTATMPHVVESGGEIEPDTGENHAPTAFLACNGPGVAGEPSWLNGWYEDLDGDVPLAFWTYAPTADAAAGATCSFSDPTSRWPSITCDGPGTFDLTLTFTDADGAAGSETKPHVVFAP